MGRRSAPKDFKLRLVEGLPGSGKSFYLVGQVLKHTFGERRPVYTNLPIVWKVMRKYLRLKLGSDAAANLIVELSEEHWKAFLDRNELWSETRDRVKAECRQKGIPFRQKRFEREFFAEHGPHRTRSAGDQHNLDLTACRRHLSRTTGVLADTSPTGIQAAALALVGPEPEVDHQPNWVEPYAVIMIDEVHHWHPVRDQTGRREPSGLQTWATMLRHHFHDAYVASQTRSQVTITLRRLARTFIQVENLREKKFWLFIRYGHFGIRGMCYKWWSAEQLAAIESNEKGGGEYGRNPLATKWVFPWRPKYRYRFRLYRSFTHVGSPAAMKRRLDEVRAYALAAGVEDQDDASKEKEDVFTRLIKFCLLCTACVGSAGAGVFLGVALLEGRSPGSTAEAAADQPAAQAEASVESWDGYSVVGVTADAVLTPQGTFTLGEFYGTARVAAVNADNSTVGFLRDDGFWVWRVGQASPARKADADQLRNLVERLAGSAARNGGSDADPNAGGGQVVGFAEGDSSGT